MSKIKIKSIIENKDSKHIFEGTGIKNKNKIIYKDNKTLTTITIDEITTIERKDENYIKINLKEGIKLQGQYITKYGSIKIETTLKKIINKKNKIKIVYDLTQDNEYIDTFIYNLEYSIDS